MKKLLILFFSILLMSSFTLAIDVTLEPKFECNPYEQTNSNDYIRVGFSNVRTGTGALGTAHDNFYIDNYYDLSNYTNFNNASFRWATATAINTPHSDITLYVDFCYDFIETETCDIPFNNHSTTFTNCTTVQSIRMDLIAEDLYYNNDILDFINNDSDKKFVIVSYLSPFDYDTQQRGVQIGDKDSIFPAQIILNADVIIEEPVMVGNYNPEYTESNLSEAIINYTIKGIIFLGFLVPFIFLVILLIKSGIAKTIIKQFK